MHRSVPFCEVGNRFMVSTLKNGVEGLKELYCTRNGTVQNTHGGYESKRASSFKPRPVRMPDVKLRTSSRCFRAPQLRHIKTIGTNRLNRS